MRLSMDIPDDLHRQAKVKAINEGSTLTAVVIRLLEQYVKASTVPTIGGQPYRVEDRTIHVPPPTGPRPAPDPPPPPNFVRPISKEDQAKGRSRK